MRNILIIACTFIYSLSFSQTANVENTRQTYLVNRVKNQESWDYQYNGDKPAKNGSRTSITAFTTSGEIAKVTTYNANGQVLHVENYGYDRNGNRTEYTRMSGEKAQKPSYQKLSAYNQSGDVTEERGYDGVENFRNEYTYLNGKLAEIKYYANNRIKETRKFSHDNTVTTVLVYNGAGTLMSKLIMRYDQNQNILEESVYGINENELEKKLFDYDENENLKEEAKYKLNKLALKTTYTYSPSGTLLEIYEQNGESNGFLKKKFTYDSSGNLVELTWRRNASDEFNSMSYTYDSKGICTTVETFYPDTEYRVLTKYIYAYY